MFYWCLFDPEYFNIYGWNAGKILLPVTISKKELDILDT